jgi:indolepyruvate ferredoxin oxidoreductase beta subunit
MEELPADPLNLILAGVGGQGNVLASRILGNILLNQGWSVTIGETFGASQRGGSVMSHLRISSAGGWSPQIPRGRAHVVVALEPTEALRVLAAYGNPGVKTLCNTRPVHSISVISGKAAYPGIDSLQEWIRGLSRTAWFLDATRSAMEMGNPVFANILMHGALSKAGIVPVDGDAFEAEIRQHMGAQRAAENRRAFDKGAQMLERAD